jgi:hypothetical protein
MTQTPEFRGRIYNDIAETMGATPLVRLNRDFTTYTLTLDRTAQRQAAE